MLALYITLAVLGVLLLALAPFPIMAYVLYRILLVRTGPEKWSRECSWDDEEQREMFRTGEEWGRENEPFHETTTVFSDGLKLVGEYFDFGNKKAVIIIPGRMETCAYSYYFAKPYKEAGYNVLAIDNRAHGLSEGKYDTVGLREHRDIIAWAKQLREKYGVEQIILHGICIGGATSIYAAADGEGKAYFSGVVAEGVYNDFGTMLKARFKVRKKPSWPFVPIIMLYIRLSGGRSAKKFSPMNTVGRLEMPILMMYSREDVFSDPANVEKLYAACPPQKRLRWFEKGIHSHIRINNVEAYDAEVKAFLETL